MAKERSIYNHLFSYFDNNAGNNIQQPDNTLNNKRTIVIRGNSPQDILQKNIELQQKQELQRKFSTTVNNGYQKALQYEAARLPAFMDFEGMEYYPIIAAALDLFMEEATCIGDNGKMLNIFSNKERIKNELENFFYNIVNVNVNLPFWTRNLCKYGDNFILQLGERGKGITHLRQMVTYEMERIEKIIDGQPKTIFKQRQTGEIFNNFEIAHFRLLSDDKNIPYGSSLLSKARRVFRQCLDENSLIWTPTGGKLIKNIKTGDIVYSYNTNNEKYFQALVKNVSNNGIRNIFEIVTDSYKIKVTDDHPILIKNDSGYLYKTLLDIDRNLDYVVCSSFEIDEVLFQKITQINKLEDGIVYDIEVDNEYHNFIAEGIVVHNCIMAEDAMLTNRLLRAADRNLIKVGVGNMDDDDIEEYMDRVGGYLKRQPRINNEDGQIDYRFNVVNNDEDIILPVRNGDSQTGIQKLEGMTSFDKIHDIEYLRDNLFIALGIPKPFLSFQDASGGGKNMAQHDIRFAKKIARIQQALIQELNKMAITHLLLLGYDSNDITNFTLSLTNPSTQQEQLKTELLQTKMQVYSEATRNEGGISAMSHTRAKRYILNMSDKEIIDDFRMQRMERALSQELQDTPLVIKRTGVFDPVDDKYKGLEPLVMGSAESAQNINVNPNQGGESTPAGSEFQNPNELPEPQGTAQEGLNKRKTMSEDEFNNKLNELVGGNGKKENIKRNVISETVFTDINSAYIEQADKLNEETEEILSQTFNTNNKLIEFDDDLNKEFNI